MSFSKLLRSLLFICLIPALVFADYSLPAGSTSQCVQVSILDSASAVGAGKTGLAYNSGSLTCGYRRQGASDDTAITMASSTLGTYTSGAFKEVDSTTMPGEYEFCPPDAALAVGVPWVNFWCGGASGMAPLRLRAILTSGNSFGFDGKQVSESGTTLGIASGGIDADNQFAYSAEIAYFDSAGLLSAVSCIVASANSGDTVTTAEDISALVANGDNYIIRANSACRNLRPTTSGRTLLVASGGQAALDLSNTTGTLDAAEIGADAITNAKIASDAIGATEIADSAIDAATLATDTITAAKIAADSIAASEIAADAIGASELAADAIGAAEIANSAIDSATFVAGSITSSAIATDAIDSAEISAAAANKIADHTLRRNSSNVEASANGDTLEFQSLYGAVAKQTNNINVVGSTLNIYKADGSTVFDTQALTSSGSAAPITGMATN